MATVQLPSDHLVPAILAGPVRARQAEHECAIDNTRTGARLQCGQADALIADLVENHREAVNHLVEKRRDRFGRDVKTGQARTARRDHDIDLRIGDPGRDLRSDGGLVVAHRVQRGADAPAEKEHSPDGVGEHAPLEASLEGKAEVEAVPEEVGKAFSEYAEEDFKPPSFDEMDQEMSLLRADRESLPSLIGERAFDAAIEDEEIEDAKAEVAKARQSGDQTAIQQAHRQLGQLVLATGIHDDSLVELREREQELADRMLNLQMQLRRMGGGNRVKQPSAWRKWIILLIVALLMGGLVTSLVLFGKN